MDLLQLLILLSITGILGAFAVLLLGFSPRGVMTLLFALIAGTIGAAASVWVKATLGLRDIASIRVGIIRIDLLYTFLASLAVVALLMGLQWFLGRPEQREAQRKAAAAKAADASGDTY